ncbi:MAG: transcription antitermination factor NusB [Sedimentisphaerales bacterium]|nr:transcription antitermination factor NusB [Sedimentisphaerales bacterium]
MPTRKRDQDPRHQGRCLALQFLFQLSVQRGENLDQLETFLLEFGSNDQTRSLARDWIYGSWHHLTDIDDIIGNVSTNWDLTRMSLVDRNNLRLAVYQLMYCPDIPAKVVINEAIELAKKFSTAQAPGFTNGILDVIYKKVKG